jgi:hypothetical protein
MLLNQVQRQHSSDWHPAHWASSSTGHVLVYAYGAEVHMHAREQNGISLG